MVLVKRIYSLLVDDDFILMLVVSGCRAVIGQRLRIFERVQIGLASLTWLYVRTLL